VALLDGKGAVLNRQRTLSFEAINKDGLGSTGSSFDIMMGRGRIRTDMGDVELSNHWKIHAAFLDIGREDYQSLLGKAFGYAFFLMKGLFEFHVGIMRNIG